MSDAVEVGDIQALVFSGHGRLRASMIVGLRVTDATMARAALRRLVEETVSFGIGGGTRREAVQLLVTAGGIRALGGAPAEIAALGRPFEQGVVAPQRSRALGDADRNAPEAWTWSDGGLDVVLLLYAADGGRVEAMAAEIGGRLAPGCSRVLAVPIELPRDEREPFGFRDGISVTRVDVGDGREPGRGVALLPPGEIVLGYRNAANLTPPVPPLGENGALVAIRQLEQDVEAFWTFWRGQARDEEEAVWLASKALGRWPNGMPVDGSAAGPQPAAEEARIEAPLEFAADAHGHKCPFGAHVRRANPRDGLGSDPATSLEIVQHHRMIRRGRSYGPPAPAAWYPAGIRGEKRAALDAVGAAEPRGLFFICLCADLARQFEFVQQTWLNNPKFADLYDEVDPIAAGHGLPADAHRFSIPRLPLRCRVQGVARWVRVRGGGYFLLPGKRALRRLLG